MLMGKGIGVLFILCGSAGMGFAMAGDLDQRLRELEQLRQLVMLLKGEIRYAHRPLPEAFLHLGEDAPAPFGDFFLRTGRDLGRRSGRSAGQIWTENMDHLAGSLHLNRQELRELRELGNLLGCPDVERQLGALDYYLERLGLAAADAAQTAGERKRLYRYLGVLGGAALTIFLL